MIRIDEIYSNIFAPLIQSRPGQCSHFFDPFGRTDFESLCQVPYVEDITRNFLFWDQEPIHLDVHHDTLDRFAETFRSRRTTLVTSEKDSEFVEKVCDRYGWDCDYYFFHGWACLDWYRGYDIISDLSRTPYHHRKIHHAIFMPNRIIGGKRAHRLGLLSRLGPGVILSNDISVPEVCPYEQRHIRDICKDLNISTTWIDHLPLPRVLPGEEMLGFPNSSFYLDIKHGTNSLVYLVTETVFSGKRHHLTEKTFKPICLGMPFILAAPMGSLEYLRSYGFKTFGDFWSEDYDNITDDEARLSEIARVVHSLDNLSEKEFSHLQKGLSNIVDHNRRWFYSGEFESVLKQEFESMIARW